MSQAAGTSGREPLATESRSHSVSIRLPLNLHRELEALARRDANTVSAVAKRLIRAGLRQLEGVAS